jgi:uncharacterized protein (TIGR02145 family)
VEQLDSEICALIAALYAEEGKIMPKNYKWLSRIFVIAFVAITASATAAPYVCGDADGSGGVDISDAVYLISYIFGGGPAPDPGCCESDCSPIVMDYDGNTYFTVKIGDQCWMAQNLKVTHYRNGEAIPNVTDGATWSGLTSGAYCEYINDINYVDVYGRLYNWYAVVDSRNIAPVGWHIPTDAEWQTLVDYLGGSSVAGGEMKEAWATHWQSPNYSATNESGFSALPGGLRYYDGSFNGMFTYAGFWCYTEDGSNGAWYRDLHYHESQVGRFGYDKRSGFSVRCVRD